jgi:hypothetical protein
MTTLMHSRRGSTAIMFALFAAALTIGMMSVAPKIHQTMMAAINKQAPLRY